MTSASELFYNWRSRGGRISDPDPGPEPSAPHPFSSDRDADLRRLRLRRRRLRRRDLGGHPAQAPPRRHPCHHRASQIELESIQLDAITASDSTGGNDGTDGTTSGIDRLRLTRSERLPGAVVQARARVIERLRGISLTESRQNTAASGISWDEFTTSGVFRLVSIGNLETEAPREWYESGSPFSNFTIESEEAFSLRNFNNRRPPGLSKEALNALKHEVFRLVEEDDESIRASSECSICLERFKEGDELMRLCCGHRFHSDCLVPWLLNCGDCPYCRAII